MPAPRVLAISAAALLAAVPPLMLALPFWKAAYATGLLSLAGAALALCTPCRERLPRVATAGLLLVVPALLSAVGRDPAVAGFGELLTLAALATLGMALLGADDAERWRDVLRASAVFCALSLTALLAHGLATTDHLEWFLERRSLGYLGTRVLPLHHNFLGLVAVCVAVGAMGFRSVAWRAAFTGFALVAAAFLTARGAVLSIAVAVAVQVLLERRAVLAALRARLRPLAALAGVAALAAALFHAQLAEAFSRHVLLAFHTARGPSTGFSGRLEIWRSAYDTWAAHPLFGAGFRVPDVADVHNTALDLLARTGLVGFAGFLAFAVLTVRAARGLRAGLPRTAALTAVTVYLVYGLFEARGVNVGNPLSALFFLMAFGALAAAPGRCRAAGIPPLIGDSVTSTPRHPAISE